MGLPEIAYLAYTAGFVGWAVIKDGQTVLIPTGWRLASTGFSFSLLFAGGFFAYMGWPQWVYTVLVVLGLVTTLTGRRKPVKVEASGFAIASLILVWLVWAGNFFA